MSRVEAPYPAEWEFDAVLSDGGTVHVRPVRPDDTGAVRDFHERQSHESIYYRFFSPRPHLSDRDLEQMVGVDHRQRVAFVALLGDDIVGMAGYDTWRARTEADVWFLVDDDQRGRGLATILLEYLTEAARRNGFTGLTAQVLPSNRKMLSVFHTGGYETTSSFEDGVIEVRFSIDPTPETLSAIEARERAAEARSVQRLLQPATVAVIGASRRPDGVGHVLVRNLIERGFTGTIYPVNPTGEPVAGIASHPSINDVPEVVDVAVVAVPAAGVLEIVEACGRRRVGGLIIVSAGFGPFGPYGRTGERLVVERARLFGMRVIGPESLGAVNTDPAIGLHASVARTEIAPGPVAYLAQSGTLGIAALEHARRVGVGISSFVDVGSKVDVSGNDLLQYWEQDDRTEVIAMHLESFGNPRKFTRLARRIGRTKPIVAVRTTRHVPPVGPTGDGPRPAHWPESATIEALLDQSGVICTDTPGELFAVARIVAQQGVVRGPAVAIVSNSTGASNLTGEALRANGLRSARLGSSTRAALTETLGSTGSVAGPVDLTFVASARHYEASVAAVLGDDAVDACIVIHAPALGADTDEVAAAIAAGIRSARARAGADEVVPVVTILLGRPVGEPVSDGDIVVPVFEFPSEAVRALGRLHRYARWLERDVGEAPEAPTGEEVSRVRALVAGVLAADPEGRWLERHELDPVLAACGVLPLASRVVNGVEDAAAAAGDIGYPVALKAALARQRPGEAGGVALGLGDEQALRASWERMVDLHGEAMGHCVVQAMSRPGPELRVQGNQHAGYGGVIGVGLGGPLGVVDDSPPVRVLPVTDADVDELLASSNAGRLLADSIDAPGAHGAIREVLGRLGQLLESVPELHAVVLDPLFVPSVADEPTGTDAPGVLVAEARVAVAPDTWEPTERVRRLQ